MTVSRFTGQVACVTGASSGIGRAISVALAGEGAMVGLVARREAPLRDVASEITRAGGSAIALSADVSDPDAAISVAERVAAAFGPVDILVAAAGQYVRAPVPDLTSDHFYRSMAVNFYGAWYVVQAD